MRFILDTNMCIYIIKKRPLQVFQKLKSLSLGQVGISSITLAELEFGVQKSLHPEKNKGALTQFLIPLEIFDFDSNAAFEYGIIRTDLERKGTIIGSMDLLIAAHVKSIGFILVTNNEKEFNRVEGLKIENWV